MRFLFDVADIKIMSADARFDVLHHQTVEPALRR
jgi:hypothetical protein